MPIELQTAIIGVVATLMGTILGWFLNTISQKGKLNIFLTNWEEDFSFHGRMGCSEKSKSKEQTETFTYRITLDLYNSSGTTKIMRNIKIVLMKDGKELAADVPQDSDTCHESLRLLHYNDVEPLNIQPKSVGVLRLRGVFSKKSQTLDYVWSADKIVLQYTNENNKQKTMTLRLLDYTHYFDNHSEDNE